jgi:hypothetical protein
MAGERYQPSSIRSIVTGIGIVVIAIVLIFCNLPNIVKTVGWALLLVPQQVGVIEGTSPDEIQTIDLSTPVQEIAFARSGAFLVYYEFPFSTNDSMYDAPPDLVITCRGTDEQVPLELVDRGLRPYDTPFAKGRPVYAFKITTPDTCQLTHSIRSANISIVPDHVTGKEAVITAAYAVQLGVLGAGFGTPLCMRVRRRRRQQREQRRETVARADAMRQVLLSDENASKEKQ